MAFAPPCFSGFLNIQLIFSPNAKLNSMKAMIDQLSVIFLQLMTF